MINEQIVNSGRNRIDIKSLKLVEEIRLSERRSKHKNEMLQRFSSFIEIDTAKYPGKKKNKEPSLIPTIKRMLHITDKQFAVLLNISDRQLSRIKDKPTTSLNKDVQEKIIRVLNIYELSVDVFESHAGAKAWLKSPQYSLNNETPLELLSSESRIREVENLLYQIEYSLSI